MKNSLKSITLPFILFLAMNNEIYTICFENESTLKQAIILLENNNLDFLYSKLTLEKYQPNEKLHSKQDSDMLLAFQSYKSLSSLSRSRNYKIPTKLAHYSVLIPKTFLRKHLRLRSSFKNDANGIETALDETIDRMLESGVITEISLEQIIRDFGITTQVYIKTSDMTK